MTNTVVHWEIIGKDHDALKKFYDDVFDWKLNTVPMPNGSYSMTGPDEGEAGIGGGIGASDDPNRRWVTFYIGVDDTDAYLRKVEANGGKVVVPTEVIPGVVTFAVFEDPEGNRVGVVKNEPPPA